MSKLTLSTRSRIDVEDILHNVGEYTNSAHSVSKLQKLFFDKFQFIAEFPKAHKISNLDSKRHAFCQRYRIIYDYHEDSDAVEILAVVHSLKKYPE